MRVEGPPASLVTTGLTRLILVAGLYGFAASPASAQSFFDNLGDNIGKLFRPGPAQEAPAAAEPEEAPPAAAPTPAAPSGWPARLAVMPPKRPAEAVSAAPPAAPVAAGQVAAALPAAVPATPASALRTSAPPAPTKLVVTAAAPAVPMAPQEPLTQQAIVERANAYFSSLTTLVADFTQVGADGRRLGGTLYLQRPGKLRFDYEAPATLQIVADGSSVAVRDRKLATQDLYSINQTPLKFLLRERVNLGQDVRVTAVANDGNGVRIDLEDRSTLGGTSKIMLFFDPRVETLQQWRIVDAQGFQTTVLLNKIERSVRLDQAMFHIEYTAAINSSR